MRPLGTRQLRSWWTIFCGDWPMSAVMGGCAILHPPTHTWIDTPNAPDESRTQWTVIHVAPCQWAPKVESRSLISHSSAGKQIFGSKKPVIKFGQNDSIPHFPIKIWTKSSHGMWSNVVTITQQLALHLHSYGNFSDRPPSGDWQQLLLLCNRRLSSWRISSHNKHILLLTKGTDETVDLCQ